MGCNGALHIGDSDIHRLAQTSAVILVRFIEVRHHQLADLRTFDLSQVEREVVDQMILVDLAESAIEFTRLTEIVLLVDRLLLRQATHLIGRVAITRLLDRASGVVGGLVIDVALAGRHRHRSVAIVVVDRCKRPIDGQFHIVRTDAVALGVGIGEQAPLQHLVGRRFDARHHIAWTEGRLFGRLEVVVRHLVQRHRANLDLRHAGPDLGVVEPVIVELGDLLRGHDLHIEIPFREVAGLDRVVEIPGRVIGVRGLGFLGRHAMHALLGNPVELRKHGLAVLVDQSEGVHAVAVHHAVAFRHADVVRVEHGQFVRGLQARARRSRTPGWGPGCPSRATACWRERSRET